MTAAVDTDIDAFIREQKLKLASERQALHLERQYQRNSLENLKKQERELREELDKNEHYPGVKSRPDSDLLYRQEWAKKHTEAQRPNYPAADVSPLKPMGKSDSDLSRENYSQHWQEVHGNTQSIDFNLSEVTPRKTKGKLDGGIGSPDYRHRWQEVHGNKQSSEKHTRRKWDAPSAPFNGSGLLRDLDADQQKSKQPRRPVHGTLLESQREHSHTQQEPSEEMSGLPLGEYEEKRKTYDAQRRQEYSEMIRENQELTPRNRKIWKEPSQEGFLPLGNHEKEQEDLRKTRKQDYLDYQQKHAHEFKQIWKEPSQEELLPLGKYEETRKKRNKERQDEYKEFLRSQQQQVRNRAWKEHPEGEALSFGHSSESQRQKLEHERREEYKAFLKEKVDGQERRQTEELDNSFGLMGLGDHRQPHPSRRQNDVQGTSDQWQTSGTRKGHPDSINGSRAQTDSIRDLLRWDSGAGRVGLTSADLVNQALREERRREYNLQLEQEDQKRRKKMQQREAQHQQDTFSFQEGNRQEKWSEEREQEYRQMLTGKSKEEKRQEEDAMQQAGSVIQNGTMDVSRKPFEVAEERQEFCITPQSQQNCGFARERHPGTPSGDGSFLSHLGSRYENERRRLREERQNEYKAMLQEKAWLMQEPVDQGIVSEKVGGSAIRPNSSALRVRQREERNRDYNMMLDQKQKQNDGQKYGSIFKENFEDNFLSNLGSRDVHRK